jgi:hypothetical protein
VILLILTRGASMKGVLRNLLGLLLAGLLACSVASALTDADISQLALVDQTELPRLMADRVAFLPDGHVALGGWFEWPNSPVVAVIPNDVQAMQVGTQAASPRFAVSPDGKSLAFWKKVKVGQEDRAELDIIRLDNQLVTTLGEPIAITEAMQLAWLAPDGPIVYATTDPQRGTGQLYALDLMGGKPRQVLELHGGQWRDLQPAGAAGQALAGWTGSANATYAVNCLAGDATAPTAAAAQMIAPDGSKRALELDAKGQLILSVSAVEGVVIDRDVRGAQWRPDGKAILYVKDKELCVVGPTGSNPRLLTNVSAQDKNVFLRGCTWSADGINVAFWGASGTSGRAWKASLGQERITASFDFPKTALVKADSHIWVVTKFKHDAFGEIVEPVWPTLKALFVVTRILRTPEGITAEASNSGDEAGTLDRLANTAQTPKDSGGHISIGLVGQPAATWSSSGTFKFRPGLIGWLEKTKYTAQPGELTVERQMLTPIGQ